MEVENRYIAVRHHVEGSTSEEEFEVKSALVQWTAESGEILLRNLYQSIDPYQLNRMKRRSTSHHSIDAIVPGERIVAHGVGEVLASACPEYEVGDVVARVLAWGEYTLFRPSRAVLMGKVHASSGH